MPLNNPVTREEYFLPTKARRILTSTSATTSSLNPFSAVFYSSFSLCSVFNPSVLWCVLKGCVRSRGFPAAPSGRGGIPDHASVCLMSRCSPPSPSPPSPPLVSSYYANRQAPAPCIVHRAISLGQPLRTTR